MFVSKIAMAGALLTVGGAGWAATAPSGAEMLGCAGLPCAEFQVGEVPLKLLIDTGNAASVLDLAGAQAMKLELAPYKRASGESVPGYLTAVLKNLKLGEELVGDVTVLVVDMKDDIAKGSFPKADGSLSYRAFKERVLTLDFRRHRLSLSGAAPDCREGCGELSYPTFGPKGPPIVVSSGFELNGVPLRLQVDTLYAGTMLIYPDAVDKTHLQRESRAKKVRNFPFTDGGVDMIEAEAPDESFLGRSLRSPAPVYFATEKVHTPGGLFDGTAGAALFNNRRVTFDFKGNRFWVQ